MTDKQSMDNSTHGSQDSDQPLQRRKFLAASCGAGVTMFAGCASESDGSTEPTSDNPGTEEDQDGTDNGTANFRLLISDMPADIGDFDRLDVSFDRARIFDGGADSDDAEQEDGGAETNGTDQDAEAAAQETDVGGQDDAGTNESDEEISADESTADESDDDTTDDSEEDSTDDGPDDDSTDDESDDESNDDDVERQRGFYNLDLDGATVDLTQVVDDRAISVFDGELSEGTYNKIELYVADIEGIVDGEVAEVKVPSGKLQITQSFEIVAGETVDFVFDINVVKRGRELRYNLTPVISKSGVRGEDVEVEEVDEDSEESEEGSDEGGDDSGSGRDDGENGEQESESDDQ